VDFFQNGPHVVGSTGVVAAATKRQRFPGASLIEPNGAKPVSEQAGGNALYAG